MMFRASFDGLNAATAHSGYIMVTFSSENFPLPHRCQSRPLSPRTQAGQGKTEGISSINLKTGEGRARKKGAMPTLGNAAMRILGHYGESGFRLIHYNIRLCCFSRLNGHIDPAGTEKYSPQWVQPPHRPIRRPPPAQRRHTAKTCPQCSR